LSLMALFPLPCPISPHLDDTVFSRLHLFTSVHAPVCSVRAHTQACIQITFFFIHCWLSLLLASCLLGLFFDPEDRSSTFLQNIGKFLPNCMVSHSTRWYSSDPDLLAD
jgi:hypothetical protein